MKLFAYVLALTTSTALASPTFSSAAPEPTIIDINDCPTTACPNALRFNQCLWDNEGEQCWEVDGW